MLTIDLQKKLLAKNRKIVAKDQAVLDKQAALDAETEKLVNAALDKADAQYEHEKTAMLETLGLDYKIKEVEEIKARQAKFAHLPQERIFTIQAIKALCIEYGLRFLPTSQYKGSLPSDLSVKLDEIKGLCGGCLPGTKPDKPRRSQFDIFGWNTESQESFKDRLKAWECLAPTPIFHIAAPAESFDLRPRPVDPLLFLRIGPDHWYLVQKWGNDLSVFRSRTLRLFLYRFFLISCAIAVVAGIATGCNANFSWRTPTVLFMYAAVVFIFTMAHVEKAWKEKNWDSPFKS